MQGVRLKPQVQALDDREIRAVVSTARRDFDFRTTERREADAFRSGMTLGMALAAFACLMALMVAGIVR